MALTTTYDIHTTLDGLYVPALLSLLSPSPWCYDPATQQLNILNSPHTQAELDSLLPQVLATHAMLQLQQAQEAACQQLQTEWAHVCRQRGVPLPSTPHRIPLTENTLLLLQSHAFGQTTVPYYLRTTGGELLSLTHEETSAFHAPYQAAWVAAQTILFQGEQAIKESSDLPTIAVTLSTFTNQLWSIT